MRVSEAFGVVEFIHIHEHFYNFKIECVSIHILPDKNVIDGYYAIIRINFLKDNIASFKNFGDGEQKTLNQSEIQALVLECFKNVFRPKCEKCGQYLDFKRV